MADIKSITGRDLRREAVEEQLRPGERLRIAKQNGKVFELQRTDTAPKSLNQSLEELLEEMPPSGARKRVDAVKMILEDRE